MGSEMCIRDSPFIRQLQGEVSALLGVPEDFFNCAFGQLYENKSQFLTWHADNEKYFAAEDVPILSWSFGVQRDFGIRQNDGGIFEKIKLRSYDLVFMDGQTQKHFKHQLYPGAYSDQEGWRFNITFRKMTHHDVECFVSS